MMRSKIPFIILIFLINYSLFAGTTGKISGQVIDSETGLPLIGVNVVIEGTAMGAATDPDGYYAILNVSPGEYTLKASMIGYQLVVQTNVQVMVDLTTPINFEMGLRPCLVKV